MMEPLYSPGTADSLPPCPSTCDPPTLGDEEKYHVFVSYSSTDYQWTHALIDQLEASGLQVCYHERDFTPGRTVLENMSDCIQESQKVLLVLSQEFVRSRWCLLEANMSLFRDCLGRKPIVPVVLEQGVPVPLHLCHLTYLEANDPDFKNKLLKVLCTTNRQLQGSTVVPFQPPSIYNGKALQPLIAVNDEGLKKYECGRFSDMEVPDQLRLVIEDHEKYRKAVRIINDVYLTKVAPLWLRALRPSINGMLFLLLLVLMVVTMFWLIQCKVGYPRQVPDKSNFLAVILTCILCVIISVGIDIAMWEYDQRKFIVREMQKAVGRANVILSEEKVLMGCESKSKVWSGLY